MEQSKFLNEVEKDKKLGDTEAAASGAKVLRYYLEFSRDAKKNKKVIGALTSRDRNDLDLVLNFLLVSTVPGPQQHPRSSERQHTLAHGA